MDIEKNQYYESKAIYQKTLDYSEKIEGKITAQLIARLYCDSVEYNYNEESDIISEILFQNSIIEKVGTIPPAYIEGLIDAIKKVDNGYKFTVLNDEEYEDLKSIVEKLKGYLAEHSK